MRNHSESITSSCQEEAVQEPSTPSKYIGVLCFPPILTNQSAQILRPSFFFLCYIFLHSYLMRNYLLCAYCAEPVLSLRDIHKKEHGMFHVSGACIDQDIENCPWQLEPLLDYERIYRITTVQKKFESQYIYAQQVAV